MIAIVDYDTGNLRSVENALARLGADFRVTSDASVILTADHVILPGVGEASSAMQHLRDRGLDSLLPTLTQPVLGICIGMQLMCRHSAEGDVDCLGIFPTDVVRLSSTDASVKVPHMGWDSISSLRTPLFDGITDGAYMYYVHSFAAEMCDATCAVTDYCMPYSAALQHGNFYGTQFHPEKSGAIGAKLIENFLRL